MSSGVNFKHQSQSLIKDKRWGTVPRELTTEKEAAVLRAKAINPKRGDSFLAFDIGLELRPVYKRLKEHTWFARFAPCS